MANVSALVSVYLELSRQKSTRFVDEFACLTYRDIWSCRGRRSSAGRRTKGCPLRASKRFVGEFAHASHTGILCPCRAWNKKLPYSIVQVRDSPLSRNQSIKLNHHCKSPRLHMCLAEIRESWCMNRRCIWGIPIEDVCEFYRPFVRSSHVG